MDINKIQNLKNQAISNIIETKSKSELEQLRICYLGRKGELNLVLKEIPSLPTEDRIGVGRAVNDAKKAIEEAINTQNSKFEIRNSKLSRELIDFTIPGKQIEVGNRHPVTKTIDEIAEIFEKLGFNRVSYPEITTDWYCFEGVNVPADHPSRDDQETFFLENGLVLSTHTTSGILQEIERVKKPPIRMLNIAKCYRRQIDISHTPMFHQFEGWLIDRGVNVGHLKWVLDYFVREFFGSKRITRLRPHHFQYTEPSFEVDINCGVCLGKGCRACKDGWMELGGSGMAHPRVLKNAGIDPSKYSGLAFGWGVERVFWMRSGLDDSRLLYQNNLKIISQF